ncbi:MAG: deoxyribose-phosphate aldolase [Christensenellales bacterium]|jgi:deoxyribose-phosphate aldolase
MHHLTAESLAKYFDHTQLKAAATYEDLRELCGQARRYGFQMVAVNPASVSFCAGELAGSGVLVGAAVGFPLGQNTLETKLYETRDAIKRGAGEIDYVINITRLKAGDRAYIKDEMQRIADVCKQSAVTSKVIFENCYLTDDEKKTLCEIAVETGIDFIKTSTGFGPGGATVEDIKLMKSMVGDRVKIKAAGGVRTLEGALEMIRLGVSRIGSSASVAIVEDFIHHRATAGGDDGSY